MQNTNFNEIHFEVKISDFGFAKQLTAAIKDRKQTICGTPAYMAPEMYLN